MTDFVIDTPSHKRWWLPDRVHQYNSIIYGDYCYDSVINARTGETVLSIPEFCISAPNWQDWADTAHELARKKFPAKADRNREQYFRSYRR